MIGRSSGWRRMTVRHVPQVLKHKPNTAMPRVTLRGTIVHTSLPPLPIPIRTAPSVVVDTSSSDQSATTVGAGLALNRVDDDAETRAYAATVQAATEYVGSTEVLPAVKATSSIDTKQTLSSPEVAPYVYQPYPIFDFYHMPVLRTIMGRTSSSKPIQWRTDTLPLTLAGIRLVDAPVAQHRAQELLQHQSIVARLIDISPIEIHQRTALEMSSLGLTRSIPKPAEFVVPAVMWSRKVNKPDDLYR
jgi:hypothetical protein